MSKRTQVALLLFSIAGLCLLAFLWIGGSTVHSYAATGAVPTDSGWYAMVTSILGAAGFSVAGIVTLIIRQVVPWAPAVTETNISEFVELSASFLALMKDRSNRAAQRRFFFALVDASKLMPGVETTHEGGVVSLQYSGFADPETTEIKT